MIFIINIEKHHIKLMIIATFSYSGILIMILLINDFASSVMDENALGSNLKSKAVTLAIVSSSSSHANGEKPLNLQNRNCDNQC